MSARCRRGDPRSGRGYRLGAAPACRPLHRSSGRPANKGSGKGTDRARSGSRRSRGFDHALASRRGAKLEAFPRDSARRTREGSGSASSLDAHLIPVDIPHVVVAPHARGLSEDAANKGMRRTQWVGYYGSFRFCFSWGLSSSDVTTFIKTEFHAPETPRVELFTV